VRFDEFVLRVPGEEFRIRFHEHLTVLAGVGALEREALVSALVGALSGTTDGTTISYVDHTGRPVEVRTDGGALRATYTDDGTEAPTPVGWFTDDVAALRSLIVVTAADLTPPASTTVKADDPPELVDAKATLRSYTEQLAAIEAVQVRFKRAQSALDDVDTRIRGAELDSARRAYARTLADLEQVRTEADAVRGGIRAAEADRKLVVAAEEPERLAGRWQALITEAERARAAVADLAESDLEPADVNRLAGTPEEAPADLPKLVAALARAADYVAALEERLHQVASEGLVEPEDERVLTLATADQDQLWAALDRAVAAEEAVAQEHVAVGGIRADGARAVSIDELEVAHAAAEQASHVVDTRRVPVIAAAGVVAGLGVPFGAANPLLGLFLCVLAATGTWFGLGEPWRARTAALRREHEALERVGVPTYLAFHLRRVDATLDPAALDRLGAAEADAVAARRTWEALSGGVDLDAAESMRAEVRAYAAALAAQHGAVQEVHELRRTLDELAVPDLAAARRQIAAAVEPYGLGAADLEGLEPDLVLGLVDRQVALGRVARLHQRVEDAEADEQKVAARLDDVLAGLGYADGELDERLAALRGAVTAAATRNAARAAARPPAEVEADLHRLNAEVRRLHRPEWDDVTPDDDSGPDLAALVAERSSIVAELAAARDDAMRLVDVDVAALRDRHTAAERRVAALETHLRGERGESADIEQVQRYLLAALTKANCVGPLGEPVPVLLDDPFVRVAAERKWELMDMLRRLSEKTQVLYLTDDAFIGAWARRRSDAGEIALLEPVD
jgi:hypothetical protein